MLTNIHTRTARATLATIRALALATPMINLALLPAFFIRTRRARIAGAGRLAIIPDI